MANSTINIHDAADLRVASFRLEKMTTIRLEAGGISITYFDVPPALAWAMFDLLRDGFTALYFGHESIFQIGANPQASADLIRRAREETLPYHAPEDDPVDTLRAFVGEAV
jgi:hypothetical protein